MCKIKINSILCLFIHEEKNTANSERKNVIKRKVRRPSCTVGGNETDTATMENSMEISLKNQD